MDMADRLAADGWKELGYEYVNIDDCWSELERDSTTRKLVPDKARFPNGIKGLKSWSNNESDLINFRSCSDKYIIISTCRLRALERIEARTL